MHKFLKLRVRNHRGFEISKESLDKIYVIKVSTSNNMRVFDLEETIIIFVYQLIECLVLFIDGYTLSEESFKEESFWVGFEIKNQ